MQAFPAYVISQYAMAYHFAYYGYQYAMLWHHEQHWN